MPDEKIDRVVRDANWLHDAARAEDQFPSISVGGLASRLGLYPESTLNAPAMFGELINLLRRKAGMSKSQLAQIANVSESDIERAERNQPVDWSRVARLAAALDLPQEKLAQLAGISEPKDQALLAAAKRLESRLHEFPLPLNPIEESALGEFMSAIH